jgi:hypothetical protein
MTRMLRAMGVSVSMLIRMRWIPDEIDEETYLNGVGSFLLRTRRGLLMPVALMALLA